MSYAAESMTIADLMRDVDAGKYYLPAIQREFVWPSEKIESLFDSLMRGYPIGVLLLWDVRKPAIHEFQFYQLLRDFDVRVPHNIKANLVVRDECLGILDGQQRITSLYIGLMGSYIEKLPRLWRGNPNAFPLKRLYINLLHQPPEDSDQRYQIKFLTDSQAQQTELNYWFPVGQILKYQKRDDLRAFRRTTPHRDNATFEDTLDRLWAMVFENRALSFFRETKQDLDEVLQIFVRLNRGATPLSYSDLLLSLATATWKTHDAREEVYGLVEDLNTNCGNFDFSKDFVLKTALVFSDGDVRFKAANIRRKEGLENNWQRVEAYLKVTSRLLRDLGFDRHTLTAANAAIPIAYYLQRRQLEDTYRTQQQYAEDRERIRIWLLTMLLGRVFGGQTDRTLTSIRRIVQEADLTAGFPAQVINGHLRASRGFSFTEEQIDGLVADTAYGSPVAFMILALLVPGLNTQHTAFHVDHLHPASQFTQQKLEKTGMTAEDSAFALKHFNNLANLSLLPGTENISKTNHPLVDWLSQHPSPALARNLALLPEGVDLALSVFKRFYEARQLLLAAELRKRLGIIPTHSVEPEPVIEDLMTGEVVV